MRAGRGTVSGTGGAETPYLIQILTNSLPAGTHWKRWCWECRAHLQAAARGGQGLLAKGEGDSRPAQAGDATT